MKEDLTLIKSGPDTGKNKLSAEKPPCKLYAVCLNKPLIELWAMSDLYNREYCDTDLQYRTSVYTKSITDLYRDDRIPGMLSPDDEMMLYNEGLSDYY